MPAVGESGAPVISSPFTTPEPGAGAPALFTIAEPAALGASDEASVVETVTSSSLEDRSGVPEDLRALAIRLAAHACARALKHAVAKNPMFVARFVDDAIAAAGLQEGVVVRLCERDLSALQARPTVDIRVDDMLSPGDVILETAHGKVGATLEDRARLLVHSAADA